MIPGVPGTLAEAVRTLFGPEVAIGRADPRASATALLPGETGATAGMVERRRREFAAGRRAARAAMAELGLPQPAVPMGPDRAPVWPEGITGSISHTDTHCLAAVARTGEVRALGLDLEPDMALDPELWPEICTRAELDWLDSQPAPERGRLARAIFSAKECVYKAQYPLTGTVLGFDAFGIVLDVAAGTFAATATLPVPPLPDATCFRGRCGTCADILVTALLVRP